MKIQLKKLIGGSKVNRDRYMKAIKVANEVINSNEFEGAIMDYNYVHGGKLSMTFKHNKGKTNEAIYDLFMSGWDAFNTEKDGDLDLSVTLYNDRFSGTIGYTYKSTFKTWINTYFFTGKEDQIISRIVGNLIHEYMHNMGFDHSFNWNATRKFTVPYAFGDIAQELALDILQRPQSSMVLVCRVYWGFWKVCKWIEK